MEFLYTVPLPCLKPAMICAVIVAAGKGTRMGPNIDKLFLPVAGRPVIAHTWERFDRFPEIAHVVVVVRDSMHGAFEEIAAEIKATKPYTLAIGGKERQNSVWNGLEALPREATIVAIQDGARPCTSNQIIRDTLTAAAEIGAAVAAQKVTDTIKEAASDRTIARNVDRTHLWAVQTPQAFRVEVIRRALSEVFARNLAITDDTAACELIKQPVRLVETTTPNPKVTTPADVRFVEMCLSDSCLSGPPSTHRSA
jgi:2-C-methyl-D-erythritol 4-phosphate cytidylyltransferase